MCIHNENYFLLAEAPLALALAPAKLLSWWSSQLWVPVHEHEFDIDLLLAGLPMNPHLAWVQMETDLTGERCDALYVTPCAFVMATQK